MQCLRRIRKRDGRCFELAIKVMEEEPGATGFTLAHGRFTRHPILPPEKAIHAWIEIDPNTIYDPVTDQIAEKKIYEDQFGAVAEARYSRDEAISKMIETGTYGPWHLRS
jgi:hypothetical protein